MTKRFAPIISLLLIAILSAPPVFACGPYETKPVFEYEFAPEDPFEDFAAGKIGIVKPTLHRSVLFAAYRYLNGGAFNANEQKALVEVWRAEFNNREFDDADVTESVKTWLAARKQVAKDEEKLPAIYADRNNANYDYFPNCTKSAFETAAKTLNARAASYGADDANVKNWLAAQDTVFANCSSGVREVPETTADAAEWLKKDRAYQSAAAAFYSLNFPIAKQKFAQIANDAESPWRDAAAYLVGRTLVREASLVADETARKRIYGEAEIQLEIVAASNTEFADAAQKLLNLVKFRVKPLARAHELANTLAFSNSPNLRQDLIDYTWLLDKIEADALAAEEKRKKPETAASPSPSEEPRKSDYEKVQDGELISVSLQYQKPSKPDAYDGKTAMLYFQFDASDEEIRRAFESEIKRALAAEEIEEIKKSKAEALVYRDSYLAGNYRLQNKRQEANYPGSYYGSEELTRELIPESLRQDDLTDWLYSYQLADADAYLHAVKRWRETNANHWLVAALAQAEIDSPQIKSITTQAERISRDSAAFPTAAYHLARLQIEAGKKSEARKFLDDILNSTLDLPVSTRNQFLSLRAAVADSFDEFLRFGQRAPFGFCLDFSYCGRIADFIEQDKAAWLRREQRDQTGANEADFERENEESYKEYRLWENRRLFDRETIKIFNRQLPLEMWDAAARNRELPEYLRRQIKLVAWTRAVLLENREIETKLAPEVAAEFPALKPLFEPYLNAQTALAKRRSALWILIKTWQLTPYLSEGVPTEIVADTGENPGSADFAYGVSWWCAGSQVEYDDSGEIKPFVPEKLSFVGEAQARAASAERAKLEKVGDAPAFFAEKVFEWARLAPRDQRVPEALFIIALANGWTKYGCGNNEETQNKAKNLLRTKYAQSRWTAELAKFEAEN